jgi:hypothetical protein
MSIISEIFKQIIKKEVQNPISLEDKDCTLLNTKKHTYYKHIYDPVPIFNILKTELHLDEDIISKFDNERRENCCNAISITLYSKDCSLNILKKYLYSINRTVKNVKKHLDDWIVRLYLDQSIYKCMENIEDLSSKKKVDGKDYNFVEPFELKLIIKTFIEIINSPNVEIYTYQCESILNNKISLEKIRTFRYLILSDPEVNLCIIREADGIVSNLDCHNIKIFSKSNKLFYIPKILNNKLILDNGSLVLYYSYQKWLILYKILFEKEYFTNHQNIYDLLAGTFGTKLKLKRDAYFFYINKIYKEIDLFLKLSLEEKIAKYPDTQFKYLNMSLHQIFEYNYMSPLKKTLTLDILLNTGFDEILLLDIYKEIISISLDVEKVVETNYIKINDMRQIINIKNSLYADNVLFLNFEYDTSNAEILKQLITMKIIKQDFNLKSLTIDQLHFRDNRSEFIDAVILKDIIYNDIFNINIKSYNSIDTLLLLLNTPYDIKYDIIYDTIDNVKRKYLKYKNKYLMLKNKLV